MQYQLGNIAVAIYRQTEKSQKKLHFVHHEHTHCGAVKCLNSDLLCSHMDSVEHYTLDISFSR